MALSPGQLALLIVVFFGSLLWLYLRHRKKIKNDQEGKLLDLGTSLTVFSILFGVLTFYLSEDSKRNREMADQRRQSLIGIEDMFMDEAPYLSALYNEMFSTDPAFVLPNLKVPNPALEQAKERHASFRIFQAVSDVIEDIERGVLVSWNTDWNFRWVLLWRTWFKSPRLRHNWIYLRQFFSILVQHFIEENIIAAEDMYSPVKEFRTNRFLRGVRRII